MNARQTKHGFTVIETLVVVAIIALTVTIIAISFSKLNASQALDKSATLITSTLDEARSLTLSSKDDSQYGVYLEASRIVLFRGTTYSSSDPANVITNLHPLVGLRNITLSGGGTSVVFKRLTGDTLEAGTMEVFLNASPETFRTITISSTGIAELN